MRVLHLLHRSVPGTHGYAIRSREIVTKQRDMGMEPIVVTSPSQAPLGRLDAEGSEYIDGIRYFRACGTLLDPTMEVHDKSPLRSSLRVLQNARLFTAAMRVASTYKPDIVHGHSPFTCGIVADLVGRIKNVPSVYEMRGIWEDSHTVRYGLSDKSLRYRGVRFLETLALKGARACCVICDLLKSEVVSRGIPEDKVLVVPNGVDIAAFPPGEPDRELRNVLGLHDRLVVGYIGSFFRYEGLELLLKAISELAGALPELGLLLVGDGETASELKQMASRVGIDDRTVFAGRLPHSRVIDYYRLCDIMVLPRRDARETRLVTPLKPLEIMAAGRPLVASDIGGHREIVEDGMNGILFRAEDLEDLKTKIVALVRDPALRIDLGRRARQWVEAHRDWRQIVESYRVLYEDLLQGRDKSSFL
ncbi:MAG: glycosyltransferase [Desulfomonilaceae bacterium]|nr:glycosyltransferase [Desulfomonilaceae bacterium]